MEFADAGDLLQRIGVHKRQGTYFQESELWKIFLEVTKGLKALHDLQILHRDLKVELGRAPTSSYSATAASSWAT